MNFRDFYNSLGEDQKTHYRNHIMVHCKVSYTSFYRWLRYPEQIPHLAKEAISRLVEKPVSELFPQIKTA